MSTIVPRLAPLGDAAITIGYGSTADDGAAAAVAQGAATIAAAALPGVIEIVPGYVALTIHYRPLEIGFAELRDRLLAALAGPPTAAPASAGRLVSIEVRYDGPDLEAVAHETGLSTDEVIARHAGVEYRVAMLGFVPGFAYLGPLDRSLVLPRRAVPRPKVPAGSVAIGGEQTGVYPADTPGGWHLLGRTGAPLFDLGRDPPALLGPGDRVRFVPA